MSMAQCFSNRPVNIELPESLSQQWAVLNSRFGMTVTQALDQQIAKSVLKSNERASITRHQTPFTIFLHLASPDFPPLPQTMTEAQARRPGVGPHPSSCHPYLLRVPTYTDHVLSLAPVYLTVVTWYQAGDICFVPHFYTFYFKRARVSGTRATGLLCADSTSTQLNSAPDLRQFQSFRTSPIVPELPAPDPDRPPTGEMVCEGMWIA
eukprot:768493-Hanusia_phi.AAC.3